MSDFDFDAAYKVDGEEGIAWRAWHYAKEWTKEDWILVCEDDDCDHDTEDCYLYDEPEEIDNPERVICVMVGDDQKHDFGIDELTKIEEDDFCSSCGQIGCCHDGR